MHLTYVPWIAAAGELKTKPTQHTVQKLREIGIQPDALLCRADRRIPDEERDKISLFTNVPTQGVISMWDVDTIYKVPRMLHEQGLDELICMKLQLLTRPADLKRWDRLVYEVEHPKTSVRIAMCGKYTDLSDSLQVAQRGAAPRRHPQPRARRHRVRRLRDADAGHGWRSWRRFDAVLVPGGFGKRGIEGKILAAQYAREHRMPYLGICLGMQVASIEIARHKAGLERANSTEFDPDTPHPVIALIDEWQDRDGSIQKRNAQSDLGGTMRLGSQSSDVKPGTLAHRIYGNVVTERHRHRYEANENYLDRAAGGRPGDLGDHAAREADRDRRTAAGRAPLVRRRAVPPRVQEHAVGRAPAVHQLSLVRPRRAHKAASAQAHAGRCPAARSGLRCKAMSPGMKLCGVEVGFERADRFSDRRPLRGRVRAAADRRGRPAEGDHRVHSASRSSSSRATTRPTAPAAPRSAARAWTRAWRSWPRCGAN